MSLHASRVEERAWHHVSLLNHKMMISHCTPALQCETAADVLRASTVSVFVQSPHIYAPPNEDFGRRNKRWNADFEGSTFPRFVAQIEYSRPWKVLEKLHFIFCSSFQNLRLGGVTFEISFMLPKRRVWKDEQRWNAWYVTACQPCSRACLVFELTSSSLMTIIHWVWVQ